MGYLAVLALLIGGAALYTLFFSQSWERRNLESQMLLPARVELYPDANLCREFYRSQIQPESAREYLRVLVDCKHCGKMLVVPIKPKYERDGEWIIRSRSIKVAVRCPHCQEVFIGRTEPKYVHSRWAPRTTVHHGPAPRSAD